MANSESTTPTQARFALTERERCEIKACSSALSAVVGIFTKLPDHAEEGGLEALESVQRRFDRAVGMAANRIDGDSLGECPVCGAAPLGDPAARLPEESEGRSDSPD